MKKKQNWVVIILFLVLVFGMTGVNILKPDRDFSDKENRVLAKMPPLRLDSYMSGEFATDYESYITDQFVIRDQWIGIKKNTEIIIGKTEINDVYLAADDYLIEKYPGRYSTELAQQNIGHLSEFAEEMLERYGQGHVKIMVVPSAGQILTDKLPPYASAEAEQAYYDKLAERIPAEVWFDSRAVLEEHRDQSLYYRTDHHWTTLAAFYAYQGWAAEMGFPVVAREDYQIETLTDSFKGTIAAKVGGETAADTINSFTAREQPVYQIRYNESDQVETDLYNREVLEKNDKYMVFFGGNKPIVQVAVENDSDRRLLVLKDSFSHCFIPFTFRDYSQVDFIDLRYFNKELEEYMAKGNYTDILFLNSVAGFAKEPSINKLPRRTTNELR